jgi:histone acetyltransferase (RNA polymerase elongator complex component)
LKRLVFFIPFQGCGRRCVYCDQVAITGGGSDGIGASPEEVQSLLSRQKSPVELCFFGGSFARIDEDRMVSFLRTISFAPEGSVVTFSSYPGDFEGERGRRIIGTLKNCPIGTIELGVPSLDEKVLRACGRDDDPERVKRIITILRDEGFHIGAQTMIGLPGQTFGSAKRDLESLASLMRASVGAAWDFRIYPCLVLRGTELESIYRRGEYAPLALEDAVREAGELLLASDRLGFRAIRVGLLESSSLRESVIAGPYHPAFGELALSERLALELAEKGEGPWEIDARKISQITGHGGRGIKRLAALTGFSPEKIRELIVTT